MRTSRAGKPPSKQRGFTYAAVLAAVVIVGIAAEVGHVSTTRIVRVDREAELFFRGDAYVRAIGAYYRAHGAYPRALADLVDDPRAPSRRHLRALYADPMAKADEGWSLIPAPDGGIAGVASRSAETPLKRANFPARFEAFEGAESYREWAFEFVPAGRTPQDARARRRAG
jgi:type II secretory pathway pseudopilin PulG